MVPEERKKQILAILEERGYASVEYLAGQVFVSAPTIRRDLQAMARDGLLERSHGGAVFKDPQQRFFTFEYRNGVNRAEKEKLCRAAAGLVEDGSTLMLDAGSTCMALARALCGKKQLRVLTNDVRILQYLARSTAFELECTGGCYEPHNDCFYGANAIAAIGRRYADYFFFSCAGLDTAGGATEQTENDITVKHAFARQARTRVLLMDHTKLEKRYYYQVFALGGFDCLVCDAPPPARLAAALQRAGTATHIAP